ncbi:MAG TPA: MBL fold metallo-hydrolase, partial [Gemmatales bacterium]|nr:MBL fold metallo-hydrolase [Gemmatales bacterium]
EGDELTRAGMHWEVRDLPGHAPGHMVFIVQSANQLIVFGGDTLFQGGIGRTDFPGGSLEQLLHGIRNKLFTLPDDTIVLPGHGDATTVGEEKRSNPYVN